uniref:Transmembrane protein 184C n=1 Tax=Lotharella oceanica TaxID=641309 RepID=A0A7S2XES0_9EUKA
MSNATNVSSSGLAGAQSCVNATSLSKQCGEISTLVDLTWFYFTERWAAAVAFLFALTASILSLQQIVAHMRYNKHRDLRNYTVRILFMVPIFSAESFLALCFIQQAPVMRMLREFYEAFALFSFTQYVITYLGSAYNLAHMLAEEKDPVRHVFPFCCFKTWPKGGKFLYYTLMGILQYIPISICITTVGLVCWYMGTYGDGSFDARTAYVYLTFVQNFSQVWALYCLVLLYKATRTRLRDINPLRKFLCIKLIVFFTWWQSFLITVLTRVSMISEADSEIKEHWNSDAGHMLQDPIGEGLTNLVICIEMVFFALAHKFAYPYTEFDHEQWKEIRGTFHEEPESHFDLWCMCVEGLNLLDFVPKIDEYHGIDTEKAEAKNRDAEIKAVNCWKSDTGEATSHLEKHIRKRHGAKLGPAYGSFNAFNTEMFEINQEAHDETASSSSCSLM